jgi:ataxin-10
VFELGGCGAVLAATRGEDGDDYLREWALWGVRNLCAGSDAARREIEQMQPQAAADSQQLTAMGLNVEVDPETGKVRVGGVKKTGAGPSAPAPGAKAPAGGALPGGLLLGPEGARTPAGKAAVAALMAGLKVDPKDVEEDGDEEFEVPSNWKVADLS